MEKVKSSKKLLCILIAITMLLSSFPLSFVQAATAVEEDCTVCGAYGYLPCTAHGCVSGKVQVDCADCSGTGSISEQCTACSGTGKIDLDDCSTCLGTGNISSACSTCNQTGKVEEDCQVCLGTGFVQCVKCAGTGKVTNEYETCPDCEGNGTVLVNCETCSGTAVIQVNCSDCEGTGSISSTQSCSNCGGTGVVSTQVDCTVCGGTGLDGDNSCSACAGSGKVTEDATCIICSGSGSVSDTHDCNTCSGTGKVDTPCTNCSGSGKTASTCSRCAGEGKILTLNDGSFTFQTNAPEPIKVGDSLTNAASSTNNTTGSITYQSEDETIASVDANGKISAKKAGVVKIKASIETDYTYSSKEIEYSITINKGVPTVESFDVSSISYQQTLADSTFSNVSAKVGDITVPGTAQWKTTTIAPSVDDSQQTEYTAVFTPSDTTNFESVEFNAKLTVNPIDITGVSVSGATVNYDGESHDSVAVTGTVEGDTVKYSTDGVEYSDANPQIKDVADSKTVYVRVTRNNNYNVYSTSAAATVNPAAVGIAHFSVYSGTYDGTAHKGVTVGSPIINGTDPVDHYVYQGTNYSECPEFIDAGEYEFTVVLSENYVKDASNEVQLKAVISKADVAITAKDRDVVYNANDYTAIPVNAQSVDDYATYTLQGSDTLASCEADGSGKNAGNYDIGLKNAVIMRGATDATANYNISYVTGKLAIAQAQAAITAKDRNVVYNANDYTAIPDDAQSVDDYATYTLQGSDTLASCEADGSGKNAGEYNVGLKNAVIMNGETDVTANYSFTYPTGKLTIAKANAVITAKDRNVVYNANDYTAIPDNAQSVDEYATYSLQGSDTLLSCEADGSGNTVGDYNVGLKNAIIMNGETNVTANYNITYPTGKLTIAKATPTVESFDVSAISYQQTLADSSFSNIIASLDDLIVPGTAQWKTTTIAPSVTDSQQTEYTAVFTPSDTTNFESVEFNAKLTVNPIDITGITVTGAKFNYDSTSHDSVKVEGTVEGDIVEYSTDGVQYSTDIPPVKNVADSKTVYVRVTRNVNYNVYNETVLAVVDPAVVGNVHLTAYSGIYDGVAHKGVTVGSPVINGTDPVDHYVYQGTNYSECPEFIDAGEHEFTVVLSENYAKEGSREVQIQAVISKADVAITAKDRNVIYNAKDYTAIPDNAQSTDDYATYALQGSDTLLSCEADGSGKTVGSYNVGLKNAVIMRGETNATANYNITYPTGKLNIAQKDVTITLKDMPNAVYTALDHPAQGENYDYMTAEDRYTIDGLAEGAGHTAQLEFVGKAKAVGTYNDLLDVSSYKIFEGETDVTANYNVTIEKGTLTISYPTFDNYTYVKDQADEGVRGWYQKNVCIKADENYAVCYTNAETNEFTDTLDYGTEGITKPSFAIKELSTGYISDVIERNEVKIDKVNPTSYDIEYKTPIIEKVLEFLTFGIYNPSTTVTLKGTDETSKIYSITYTVKQEDLDSGEWTTADPVEVLFEAPLEGEKTTEVSFSGKFRGEIEYFVTDDSGRVSTVTQDTKGIITDSVAPEKPVITIDKEEEYASPKTFAGKFDFNVSVSDDNSGIADVEVKLNGHVLENDANGNLIENNYAGNNLIKGFEFVINSSQIDEIKDEKAVNDGEYTLSVKVTDNAGNVSENSLTAYIDVFAPKVTGFSFESKGKAYYGDKAYEQGEKASVVEADTSTYSYYFEKNTFVTVYVCDYENEFNLHTAGVKDISLIAVSNTNEIVKCTEVADSFVQNENGKIGYSTKTFLVEGPFKGNIYAIAEDYASNTPTNDDSKGWVDTVYQAKMSEQYEGYVNPYDTVLEDIDKHIDTSDIEIIPNDKPVATEDGQYKFPYSGDGSLDQNLSYNEAKVPLYSKVSLGGEYPSFTIIVSDNYSGIKEIKWNIIGQPDQDSENDQSGTVSVKNDGSLSGESGWTAVSNPENNLIHKMSRTVSVKNDSNDIAIVVELTDRAGNKSYDYYILGLDTTAPVVTVNYDNNSASEGKYFKASRTATVTVVDRNFDENLINVLKNGSRQGVAWSESAGVNGNRVYTAKVGFGSDGDYTFEVNGKDKGRNGAIVTYNGTAPRAFTVDLTDPIVTVTYQSSATAKNGNYYSAPRTATIVVNEHNWNPDKFIFTLRMNDGAPQKQKLSWSNSGDTHTAKFTADSKTGDKYTLDFECKDRADRDAIFVQNSTKVRDYKPETFFVDQQNPDISFEFNGKDTQDNMNETTNKEFSSTVSVKDTYYDFVEIDIIGKAHRYSNSIRTSNTSVDIDSVIENISKDNKVKDDFYTLTITANDKAGNTSKIVRYFAVNRNGSIFTLGEAASKLVEKKYTNNKNDLKEITIRERNIDPINVTKSVLQLNVGGKVITLESGKDYTVSGGGSRESNGYYNVIYNIKESVFAEDALYKLLVTSTDAAGNTSKNYKAKGQDPADKELPILLFTHDETAPIININLDESKKDSFYSINASEYVVKFTPVDDGSGIDYDSISLSIGRGDKARIVKLGDEEYDFKRDEKTGEYSFVLKGNNYDVTLNYKDKAGNDFEQLIFEHIGISSNVFQRFFYNTGLFIGVLVGIVVVAAAIIVLIATRRKKKASEEA